MYIVFLFMMCKMYLCKNGLFLYVLGLFLTKTWSDFSLFFYYFGPVFIVAALEREGKLN